MILFYNLFFNEASDVYVESNAKLPSFPSFSSPENVVKGPFKYNLTFFDTFLTIFGCDSENDSFWIILLKLGPFSIEFSLKMC